MAEFPERIVAGIGAHHYTQWDTNLKAAYPHGQAEYVRADLYEAKVFEAQQQATYHEEALERNKNDHALLQRRTEAWAVALEELLSSIVDTHSGTPEYEAVANVLNELNLNWRFTSPDTPERGEGGAG